MKNKIFSIFISLCILFSTVCFATDGIIRDINPNLPSGAEHASTVAETIIGAAMWIGYAIAIGMIVFIGIKYVIASADEKANLKGMLLKVVIGSFIIVFSLTIANAVIQVMTVTTE